MPLLTDIKFWTKQLGHLPVHLTSGVDGKYIMLNGVSGNFCLHFSDQAEDSNTYFSQSWSSNTKNFLVVNEANVKLYNWHKSVNEENIPINLIRDNVDKFYQYLVARSHKSDKDVVPFVINIFRQFRTYTYESGDPVEALNLLFVLLASLEDGNVELLNKSKWGISDIPIPQGFDNHVERFKQGIGNIEPDLNLILRHSAGALFQEAQKEVVFFDTQFDLFGAFSGALITRELLYSSIHYTPSYLARSIVENALKLVKLDELQEIKILDPACGSGEFLIEALKQLKEKNYSGKLTVVGLDNSQTAVNTTSFLLTYERRTWGENLSFEIKKVTDSLTEEWTPDYNIILMNPPFVSWELLNDKDKREAVREILGNNFSGKPNQASAFFYKAIKHLAANGVLGCVVPSSLFTMDAYQKLRTEINESFTIDLLGKLGNFVFEDALTDASIVVGKKPKDNNIIPTLLWTRNEKGVAQDVLRELRKMQYADEPKKDRIDFSIFKPNYFPVIPDSWKPVSLKEHDLIRDLKLYISTGKLCTVTDVFNVQQGIRTGNNNVFKISELEFNGLPEEEKKYFRPVIDNDSVSNGCLKTLFYTWYPYNRSGLIIKTEVEFKEKAPVFYDKIVIHKDSLSRRARKNQDNWWHLSEHRAWQRIAQQKLVSTEFGNSASFAIDIKGNYVVERGYAWQSKKKFSKDDLYFYLALFSSPFFEKLLSIYSRQLLAAWDLGKKYTKEIPIPDVHLESVKNAPAYSQMVDLGRRLSLGESYVKAILNDVLSVYYPQRLS